MPKIPAIALFLALAACGHDPVESKFLVQGDRLPSWVDSKYITDRSEVQVEIIFHTSGVAEMLISKKAPKDQVLERIFGRYKGKLADANGRFDRFPRYFVVEANSRSDIYEQRAAEPIVYVVETPQRRNHEP